MPLRPFHLAIAVNDMEESRSFYGGLLGCSEGRSSDTWIDFDFFGHQLVVHLAHGIKIKRKGENPVDGKSVSVPHFGVVLEWEKWHILRDELTQKGVQFIIDPYIRFEGLPGEQATLFFQDPFENVLEFKSFKDPACLFSTQA